MCQNHHMQKWVYKVRFLKFSENPLKYTAKSEINLFAHNFANIDPIPYMDTYR